MRLFVAMLLSDAVRARLEAVQNELRRSTQGVRWIPAEQLHLTVKFLGEVPDIQVPCLTKALQRAASESNAFSMQVSGCGCFPPRGAVRIVWTGIEDPSDTLATCVEAVEHELQEQGYPRETRSFSPHITIGRVRDGADAAKIRSAVGFCSFPPIDQFVESVTLMSSVLSPKGPTYAPAYRATLRTNTES